MQTIIETPTGWMIKCQNCQWHEFPKVGKPGASWQFNGDLALPTFTPSMNELVGPYPDGTSRRCHFIVTNGQIKYCGDCSHSLANQIIPLLPWEQAEIDYYKLILESKPT